MRKPVICFIVFFIASSALAFRISRPPTFSLPWTQDQITQLNDSLESFWNLQNGEFNLDIETTTKTNADNGDIWILTGVVNGIQFKMNDQVYTLTPD